MTPAARVAALLALLLLATAFIGRAVVSADGAEMVSEALGLLVTGSLSVPTMPAADPSAATAPPQPFHSHYGFFPSAFLVPFVAWAWPLRGVAGPAGYDAAVALTWAIGALACAVAFHRLAAALRPGASPLWVPAFLGGTFLWPYAADSFLEPFAGAALALAAERLLRAEGGEPLRRGAAAGAWVALAAALKPILWTQAPLFLLAAALGARRRGEGARAPLTLGAAAAAGLAAVLVANGARYGAGSNFGYGGEALLFSAPLLTGLAGLLVSPGRGLLLLSPVALVAVARGLRLRGEAALLCLAAPLVHVLLIARWYGWHGGSSWGPRHVLPILPLLVAPAVLASRRLLAPFLAAGAAVNLPGVLVAAGAWISYVERLEAPPGRWAVRAGSDRVSTEAGLAPVYGHTWLLARALGFALPAPWLADGVREGMHPPGAAECLSPWLVRRAAGLRPVPPMVPSLLYRASVAALRRGRPDLAPPFLRALVRLDPGHRAGADLLGQLERAGIR